MFNPPLLHPSVDIKRHNIITHIKFSKKSNKKFQKTNFKKKKIKYIKKIINQFISDINDLLTQLRKIYLLLVYNELYF